MPDIREVASTLTAFLPFDVIARVDFRGTLQRRHSRRQHSLNRE